MKEQPSKRLDAVDGQNRTFCCQETNFREADSMLLGPAQLPESFDVACLLMVSAVGCATSTHRRYQFIWPPSSITRAGPVGDRITAVIIFPLAEHDPAMRHRHIRAKR
jgi:hypothetical protein